jgi:site-specific recombinase XerD
VPLGKTAQRFLETYLYHVKELLGHESLATVRYYANLTSTDLKRTHARCHPREKDE